MTQPSTFRRFPDAAKTVAKLLESFVPATAKGSRVGTRTPDNLTGLMPFIRVVRDGGPSDMVNDYALLYIDVFSDSLAAAEKVSEQIREKLTTERLRLGGAVVDSAVCTNAPTELPPWAPGINRFESRYTVVFRRYNAPA
jgi:hypothetical protein